MGGFGSTRWHGIRKKRCVEDCRIIQARTCPACGKPVRKLYGIPQVLPFRCRTCNRLTYKQRQQHDRTRDRVIWNSDRIETEFQKLAAAKFPNTLKAQLRLWGRIRSLRHGMFLIADVAVELDSICRKWDTLSPRARSRIIRKFSPWIFTRLTERSTMSSGDEQPSASVPG